MKTLNNSCPLCGKWYIMKYKTIMDLEEPLFKGYCHKCRPKVKQDYKDGKI